MAVSNTTTTVELTDEETIAVRDAITTEMTWTCKVIRQHLREHLGGSTVGLVDARNWTGRLAMLAGVMDRLDPPGWKDALPGPEEPDELARKRQVS